MDASRFKSFFMLNFEIRPTIIFGFSLYWAWVWIVFWSSLFYSATPERADTGFLFGLGPLWSFSLFFMSITLVVLYFVSSKGVPLGARNWCLASAALATGIGTALVAVPELVMAEGLISAGYAVGAAVLGAGSAFWIALWGELLTILGSRQTIVYFVSSTLVSTLIYIVFMLIEPVAARVLVSLFSVISMVLLRRARPIIQHVVDAKAAQGEGDDVARESDNASSKASRRAVLELLSLSLFFGTSYGVMKGLFILGDNELIAMRDVANIVALISGSVAVFITMAAFHMDFRRLTYQIALPLMAAGFLLFPIQSPFNIVGFTFHQFGYQYFYAIIWAMWPVLVQKSNLRYAQFASVSLLGVQGGQLLGSVIGALVIRAGSGSYYLAEVSSVCVFVVFLVSLFWFGDMTGKSTWITLRPFDQKPTSWFKSSLQKLAAARGLSPRETEVFIMLAHGRNKAAIAKALVVSENTAKTHIRNVYSKFGVHSQQDLLDMIELDAKSG